MSRYDDFPQIVWCLSCGKDMWQGPDEDQRIYAACERRDRRETTFP